MAVGIRIKLPGVTQEQFDAAHDHINPDRSPWPGMLFHSSGPIDGGWGVIDFWESRADFDAHLESNIQPGIAASGVEMQGPPDIKEFPVHEIIHPSREQHSYAGQGLRPRDPYAPQVTPRAFDTFAPYDDASAIASGVIPGAGAAEGVPLRALTTFGLRPFTVQAARRTIAPALACVRPTAARIFSRRPRPSEPDDDEPKADQRDEERRDLSEHA